MEFLFGMLVGACGAGAFAWMFPNMFKATADSVDAKFHNLSDKPPGA